MNIVQVDNIEYSYGDKPVLKGISFEVKNGSFISLIGPNGSGKSTLLKIINSTYKSDVGNIHIKNNLVQTYTAKELAKLVAMVPQYSNIDYEFTVLDIVLMGRFPHKKRFEKYKDLDLQKAADAMKITNTYKFKDRKITELSGGERQRVIIAKAICQDSDIILLDEPTSSLDINHQIEIMEFLKELNAEGKTIIMVLHDINLSARYTEEIILLKDGKILDKGRPEDVINKLNMEKAYNLNSAIEKNKYTDTLDVTPISII